MRGNKYRGKRVDNGECIYGYLIGKDVIVGDIIDFDDEYFTTEFWYKVVPKTVGQFTGLHDKNGVEIYENDIIEVKTDKYHFKSQIIFDEMCAGFEFQDGEHSYCGLDALHVFENGSSLYGGFVEVIGNIHESEDK